MRPIQDQRCRRCKTGGCRLQQKWLDKAVSEHAENFAIGGAIEAAEYYDDLFHELQGTGHHKKFSPSDFVDEIELGETPYYVPVGWLDAGTANGALWRFNTLSNPQSVFIGPWSHNGSKHVDPFLPDDTPTQGPPGTDLDTLRIKFFDEHLLQAPSTGTNTDSSVTYYTLGAGTWQTTPIWPPRGFSDTAWYFAADGVLSRNKPTDNQGKDNYTVDFSTTTGLSSRWKTNFTANDVIYPDRSEEDRKLLTYTSARLEADLIITGSPIVTLYVRSSLFSIWVALWRKLRQLIMPENSRSHLLDRPSDGRTDPRRRLPCRV